MNKFSPVQIADARRAVISTEFADQNGWKFDPCEPTINGTILTIWNRSRRNESISVRVNHVKEYSRLSIKICSEKLGNNWLIEAPTSDSFPLKTLVAKLAATIYPHLNEIPSSFRIWENLKYPTALNDDANYLSEGIEEALGEIHIHDHMISINHTTHGSSWAQYIKGIIPSAVREIKKYWDQMPGIRKEYLLNQVESAIREIMDEIPDISEEDIREVWRKCLVEHVMTI